MTRLRNRRAAGFTLLEIMLAVAVLGLVTVSIYRFVDTTLTGVRLTTEHEAQEGADDAFERFFREQMMSLPVRQESLMGEPHVFSGVSMDEVRWYALPGFGSFTQHALGEQQVTLTVQETKSDGPLEIGLRRVTAALNEDAQWYPLLSGVKALEIRYYNATTQEWVDKWTEQLARPSLVRLRYWRGHLVDPVEIVASIPPLSAEALSPQLIQSGVPPQTSSTIENPRFSTRPASGESNRSERPRNSQRERRGEGERSPRRGSTPPGQPSGSRLNSPSAPR